MHKTNIKIKITLHAAFLVGLFFFPFFAKAAPTITFSADPAIIASGSASTLTWDAVGAVSCTASGSWSGSQAISGTYDTGAVTSDQTYTINCLDGIGESSEANVTVSIADPPTLTFYADDFFVEYNASTDLNWTTTDATSCVASGAWSGDVGVSGIQNTGNLISTKVYDIECSGPGGIVQGSVQVNVGSPVDAPSLTFGADDYFLEYNESTNLNWVAENVDVCTASGSWSGTKSLIGTESTGNLTSPRTYSLKCDGSGGSVTKIVNIVVAPEPTFPVELTFEATPDYVDYGNASTLSWTTNNADSCTTDLAWDGESIGTDGTYDTGALLSNTSYEITCTGPGGSANLVIEVSVGPNPFPTPSLNFFADLNTVQFNTPTDLHWSTSDADTVTADGDWSGSLGLSGDYGTGNLQDDRHYEIDVSGPGGDTSGFVDITVDSPTMVPNITFWPDSYSVIYNNSTTLHWTSEFADVCTLNGNVVGLNGNFETDNLVDPTNLFVLICSNEAGGNASNVNIAVSLDGPPPVINLSADALIVDHGTSTTLHWNTAYADECMWGDTGIVGTSGSRSSGAIRRFPRTFTMQCIGSGGISSESITIDVEPASLFGEELPDISIWADETEFLSDGETNVHWNANIADSCVADGPGWTGDIALTGTIGTGYFTTTRTYTIICENYNGSTSASVTLTVTDLPDVTLDYWADETVVPLGGSTNLNWYANNALNCAASGSWSGSKAIGTDAFETVGPLNDFSNVFTLYCYNWTSSQTGVAVVEAGSPPPEVTISANHYVAYNNPALIVWDSEYADYCTAWPRYNSDENTWIGTRGPSGSQLSTNLVRTTYFYITCFGPGGYTTKYSHSHPRSSTGTPPQINFWSDRYAIEDEGDALLQWSTTGADSCSVGSAPTSTWLGSRSTGGTESVYVTEDTQYIIQCTNSSGTSTAKLTVYAPTTNIEKPSLSFWADNYIVASGSSTTLRWNVENATSCEATGGDWTGFKASSTGSESVGPIDALKTYELTCSNSAGSISTHLNVGIGGVLPNITLDLWADDYDLAAGETTTLRWTTTNASICYASGGGWTGWKNTNGSAVVAPNVSQTFQLTCNGPNGVISRNININVAKLIVCPNPAIVTKGTSYNLTAWYKKDADNSFSCDNTSGGYEVTNGYDEPIDDGTTGTIDRVQYEDATGDSTASATFDDPPTEGSLLIAITGTRVGNDAPEEATISGTGWTRVINNYFKTPGSTSDRRGLAMFYKIAEAGEPSNIQTRWSMGGRNNLVIQEFTSGGDYDFVFDVAASANSGSNELPSQSTGETATTSSTESLVVTGLVTRDDSSPAIWTDGLAGNVRYYTYGIAVQSAFDQQNSQGQKSSIASWSYPRDATAGIAAFSLVPTGAALPGATNFFPTVWNGSGNDAYVESLGAGQVFGHEYTSLLGSPVPISATYKEAVGTADVEVLPPPVTCWGCSANYNCVSQVFYPEDGICPVNYYSEADQCRAACKKPTDWIEVSP